jgi:hypothetical protein
MKTILSYGMGIESSSLIVYWCENRSRLDFDLTEDLIAITAMTGDEHIDYVEFRRISSVGTLDRKASPLLFHEFIALRVPNEWCSFGALAINMLMASALSPPNSAPAPCSRSAMRGFVDMQEKSYANPYKNVPLSISLSVGQTFGR